MHDLELKPGEQVKNVHFTEDTLAVDLIDGRTIIVPLVWYPRLLEATKEQRANWKISGGGFGIHWPDVDEDLSTKGLLRGASAESDVNSDDSLKDFLLAEFELAWQQVFHLEERRFKILAYFTAVLAAILGLTVKLVMDVSNPGWTLKFVATLILISTIFAEIGFIFILDSERKASSRYTNKINEIRNIFLGDSKDPKIEKYINRSDIGTWLTAGHRKGWGRTLHGVLSVLILEMFILAVGIFLVWFR